MSNAKTERKELIENLKKTWPGAKIGKLSNEDLLWLAEIAALLIKSGKNMAEILRKYRAGYEISTTATGRKSLRCGDVTSIKLTGLTGFQAIDLAEKLIGVDAGILRAKYEHLNEGQRKMNAGNRIRGALKRGEITEEQIESAKIPAAE